MAAAEKERMSDKPLLKLLRQGKRPIAGDAGKTVKELAVEIFGSDTKGNRIKVWDRLGPELESGKVVFGRGIRMNRAGIMHAEPVYRVASKK